MRNCRMLPHIRIAKLCGIVTLYMPRETVCQVTPYTPYETVCPRYPICIVSSCVLCVFVSAGLCEQIGTSYLFQKWLPHMGYLICPELHACVCVCVCQFHNKKWVSMEHPIVYGAFHTSYVTYGNRYSCSRIFHLVRNQRRLNCFWLFDLFIWSQTKYV